MNELHITEERLRDNGWKWVDYGFVKETSPDTAVRLVESGPHWYPVLHQYPEMSHQEPQAVSLPYIDTMEQLDQILEVMNTER
jgi:hypothetical protein